MLYLQTHTHRSLTKDNRLVTHADTNSQCLLSHARPFLQGPLRKARHFARSLPSAASGAPAGNNDTTFAEPVAAAAVPRTVDQTTFLEPAAGVDGAACTEVPADNAAAFQHPTGLRGDAFPG